MAKAAEKAGVTVERIVAQLAKDGPQPRALTYDGDV